MLRIIITVLLFGFSIVANGELYKWVDSDGKTQYTDQPPPSGAAISEKKLKIKLPPVQSAGGDENDKPNTGSNKNDKPKSWAERELDFKKRRVAEEKKEKKRQAKLKESKEKCFRAKSKLKLYQEAPKLTVSDGKGGVMRADDAARQKGINEAQKEIESFCS